MSTETRVTLVPAAGRFEDRSPTSGGAATVLRAGAFDVPPGWRLPLRIAEFHVLFVGVRGHLRFTAGGREHELGPGATLWLPRHHAHQATCQPDTRQVSRVYVAHFSLPRQDHPTLHKARRWPAVAAGDAGVAERCERLVTLLRVGTEAADLRADAELNLLLADLQERPADSSTPTTTGAGGRSADIARVLDHITRNTDQPLRVSELASLAGLQRGHFSLLFGRLTGLSPSQYVTAARIARARELLEHGELPLDAVAERCGFSSASHLARRFKEYEGIAPGGYRDRHGPARNQLGRSVRR